MKKIRAIIVDDEESARDVLENLLLLFCSSVEIISKCSHVEEAVERIKKDKPDVVFLDIEMPKYAGYEIVKHFDKVDFQIIFVTAYNQYAIKAFEVAALDYLLKPVNIDRLQEAVERVAQRTLEGNHAEQLKLLKNTLENNEIKSLLVYDKGQQHLVAFEEIIAIEAMESYCVFHCIDKQIVASKNLAAYEKILEGNNCFFRIHRSWMINQKHILHYSKSDLSIQLKNNLSVKLSKYRKIEFEDFLIR